MRTGRLRPSWSRSLRQTGWPVAHEPHRAAQAAILESIAHAMLLALHSLHCTDKCPRGRSGPWRRLTLAPTALPSFSINTMVAVAAIRGMSADP
jgi:hypothetical protein